MGYEQSKQGSAICHSSSVKTTTKKPPPDQGLNEQDQQLFDSLRQWRVEKSKSEGVPPYVILTNKQLREIVEKKPRNKTALGKIESLGTARIKRHGEEILRRLHSKNKSENSPSEKNSNEIGEAR
jgi:superfamily II DNA helicase RecQ